MRMKKKRNGAHRLSLLSSLLCENATECIENSEKIYGNSNPVRIEIGCGKGDFIKEKSVREGNYNYLAIEKIADVCVLAIEKYAVSRGLGSLASNGGWELPSGEVVPLGSDAIEFPKDKTGNVRFAVGDAKAMLPEVKDNSVDAIYINFCDPWSKKGYAKRRLTYISFLEMYSRILKEDGKLYFKTDNRELFDFSVEEIKKSPLEAEYITYDLHASDMNESNIETEYERNFCEKGFKINMLIAKNNKK